MAVTTAEFQVTWEKLPDDFLLEDDPVDNINQPSLAAALTESLEVAGLLPANALTTTNYGICATVNGQTVVKAPDWGFVPQIWVPREEVKRSYTPRLQGDTPLIVMEFLSDTEGGEYSSKPTYPPGKWFFYEQILVVPNYAILEPESGRLELYRLDDSQQYRLCVPDRENRYWIEEMGLALGVWQGSRENRTGYWLRWWNQEGKLLLWGTEKVEQLKAQLRAAGLEPDI
jgi:Uma2 family endonuclease